MIPPAVLTALDAIRDALPLLALALAFWAHWRADHAEARLAAARLDLYGLVDVLAEHEYSTRPLHVKLHEGFPHLFDQDARQQDERAAERAS